MNTENICNKLIERRLKVTPQRTAILEAIYKLHNHPTVEQIIEYIRKNYPNISTGTVYKVLDTFVSCGLVTRVQTERDIMRYDEVTESHHHIYCSDSEYIEDYIDEELNKLLKDYFDNKNIPDFKIEELKLNIIGRYTKSENNR
jgi:Fur family peroxide stress response transcriptional regulator